MSQRNLTHFTFDLQLPTNLSWQMLDCTVLYMRYNQNYVVDTSTFYASSYMVWLHHKIRSPLASKSACSWFVCDRLWLWSIYVKIKNSHFDRYVWLVHKLPASAVFLEINHLIKDKWNVKKAAPEFRFQSPSWEPLRGYMKNDIIIIWG